MKSSLTIPPSYKELKGKSVINSFNGSIDLKILEKLSFKEIYSICKIGKFTAKIWQNNTTGWWNAEIWVKNAYQFSISGETIQRLGLELMSTYGDS